MQQTPEEEAKTGPGQSAQPLYEYPAPTASQATPPQQGESQSPSVDMAPEEEKYKQPGTISEQDGSVVAAPNEDRPAQEISAEDIRSGLVYPPHPHSTHRCRSQPLSNESQHRLHGLKRRPGQLFRPSLQEETLAHRVPSNFGEGNSSRPCLHLRLVFLYDAGPISGYGSRLLFLV